MHKFALILLAVSVGYLPAQTAVTATFNEVPIADTSTTSPSVALSRSTLASPVTLAIPAYSVTTFIDGQSPAKVVFGGPLAMSGVVVQ